MMAAEPNDRGPGLRGSPLTDPRSVVSSVAFHAALLLFASTIALSLVDPGAEPTTRGVLKGEIGPVDTRAPEEGGGGGPGELGGVGPEIRLAPGPDVSEEDGERRTTTLDSMLAEAIPGSRHAGCPARRHGAGHARGRRRAWDRAWRGWGLGRWLGGRGRAGGSGRARSFSGAGAGDLVRVSDRSLGEHVAA